MIRVELSKGSIIGVGFAYRPRLVTEQEEALLQSAQKVLNLSAIQLEAVRRDALRHQLKFTKCVLYRLGSLDDTFKSSLKVIAEVSTPCSEDDNFCKEKGRKAALADAMEKAGISKSDRLLVWTAYRNRPRTGGRKVESI